MLERKPSFTQVITLFTGVLILLTALSMPTTVYADDPAPDNGKCISCHEDQYFLHDTGNWFCLRESPMACADCHGGDPTTPVKEKAHLNRASHPVVNNDVSKCQECHPDECDERMELFDQTAGISEILVAAPYIPAYSTEITEDIPATRPQGQRELIVISLISGITLMAYLAVRIRHMKKGNQ
jgi:hypothetical protein